MYAIIISGGKQYKVREGEEVLLEKTKGAPGDKIEIGEVIFLSKNGDKVFNKEELAKTKVKGEIVEQTKDDKIIVFKYMPKKGYRRKKGHRQLLTKVRVEDIDFPGKPANKELPKPVKKETPEETKKETKGKIKAKTKAAAKSKAKVEGGKKPAKAEKSTKEKKKAAKKSKKSSK